MTDSPALAPSGEAPDLLIAPAAMAVLERLWAEGHAALVVGGAVRDLILRQQTVDWDVATDARPERVLAIFPDGVYENRFGTVSVGDVQITTFRRDHRYADHRRPESVTFTDDAFEDLARRDLTINAIAWGRLRPGSTTRSVDPADGIADLRAGVVRAVGDPDERFDEDALRMLRAILDRGTARLHRRAADAPGDPRARGRRLVGVGRAHRPRGPAHAGVAHTRWRDASPARDGNPRGHPPRAGCTPHGRR